MGSKRWRGMPAVLRVTAMCLPLCACVVPVVSEIPASEPSQAEKSVCRELAAAFPTWADDGQPETVANRIDTAVSLEEGALFTNVFQAVCPGALP